MVACRIHVGETDILRSRFVDFFTVKLMTGAVTAKGTANLKQYSKKHKIKEISIWIKNLFEILNILIYKMSSSAQKILNLNDVCDILCNIAGSNDDGQKHSACASVLEPSVTHVPRPARLNWLLGDVVHCISRALHYRRGYRRFETRLWQENLIPG